MCMEVIETSRSIPPAAAASPVLLVPLRGKKVKDGLTIMGGGSKWADVLPASGRIHLVS